MFTPFDSTGGGVAKENERYLLQWEDNRGLTTNPHSTAINGLCIGYAECSQRYYFRANTVS